MLQICQSHKFISNRTLGQIYFMARLLLLALSVLSSILMSGQPVDTDTYLRNGEKVPQVLLLGTFHFGFPGLDTHKTKDEYKLDILSDQRQEELHELLDYIKRFNPTKIMIEAGRNTGYLMHRMRRWKRGEEKLGRRESDQLAIRLADELGLDTIYGVNASSLLWDMENSKDSLAFRDIMKSIFADRPEKSNGFDERYMSWYDEVDRFTYESRLLDFFKYSNSDFNVERMHGHYVLNDGYDDYNNMDGWFLLEWYSRNLRILKNIQRIETSKDDRILVLFGLGHIGILKQQFESLPEYELVKFSDLEDH